jgi:hypothetical protein
MAITGRDVKVSVRGSAGDPGHPHRSWKAIRGMIEGAGLGAGARARAIDIFRRLAEAEASIHGVSVDDVQFHEVGAVDSIVDIVGAALALDYLSPVRVTSRPIPLGRGFTRCTHGVLPVPSPAALRILAGAQVEDGGVEMELCTPTGAAIAASVVDEYRQLPAATVAGSGYGVGDRKLDDRPNLLRAILFEPEAPDCTDTAGIVLEANIDNMPPEWCGHLLERLFATGARDVWFTPIIMKKGRPALTLSVLCAAEDAERLGDTMFAESTTIGLRYRSVGRRVLGREVVEVETQYGPIAVKLALDGERVVNAAPEYESCRAAAQRCRVPLKEVYAAALTAYRSLAEAARAG